MTYKKPTLKIFFCFFLAFTLFLPFGANAVFADTTTLTVANLINNYADGSENDQEITDKLGFTTDFGDVADSATLGPWTTPTSYTGVTFDGSVEVVDFTSEEPLGYGDKSYKDVGTDGILNNKYGLLFLTTELGLAGIESPTFTVPAHALYVLTFNVKIGEILTSPVGLNAKLINTTDNTTTIMPAIKTKNSSYTTYAFLISGNEFTDTAVKIQLLWGNVTKTGDTYTSSKELGYAAVDTFRLFTVTSSQYKDLASVTANTKANLYKSNPAYSKIENGYFMFSDVSDVNSGNTINDFKPSGWTQTTVVTDESNRVANYGIIDVDPAFFTTRIGELGLNLTNPGNPNDLLTHNNVLLLYNETDTWQTITSSDITLAKSSYFEISFKFNTPSGSTEGQTNSLSFYIVDADGTTILYSKENMYSYTENTGSNNEWATFRTFIETSTLDKKVNFVIKFGTDTNTKSGVAYVDEVELLLKSSASTMFDNTDKDTYVLKTKEGEEVSYLKEGTLSFTDLQELDLTNSANRALSTYSYVSAITPTTPTEPQTDPVNSTEPQGPTTNLSYLWYVIPSILLAVCTIFGLIIFYAQRLKSKIKLPKRRKKNSYDRKKTLEKQVASREKAELKNKNDTETQLKTVRSQIKNLENNYQKSKSNKLALKEYITKREKLQNRETKLLEQIDKKTDK